NYNERQRQSTSLLRAASRRWVPSFSGSLPATPWRVSTTPPGYQQSHPGYPSPQAGYPPPQGGYPPPHGGYPPPHGGYPPPQGGYPPPQGYYPPPQHMQQTMSTNNVIVVGQQAPVTNTVIVQRRGVNHCLHCIISLFFWPWLIVWLCL
ncbi:unnamed protein product, partial [Candidula unifasciata]